MKVHDDQSVIEQTGSTPLKYYSPTVLLVVSTLLESWPIKRIARRTCTAAQLIRAASAGHRWKRALWADLAGLCGKEA
jgi:hypothetical protein